MNIPSCALFTHFAKVLDQDIREIVDIRMTAPGMGANARVLRIQTISHRLTENDESNNWYSLFSDS